MTFLKYDEAMIWLTARVNHEAARNIPLEDLDTVIFDETGVSFEQDAIPALADYHAGTIGENDPGSQNNSCLGRRGDRR